jgi:hypothetical protein
LAVEIFVEAMLQFGHLGNEVLGVVLVREAELTGVDFVEVREVVEELILTV